MSNSNAATEMEDDIDIAPTVGQKGESSSAMVQATDQMSRISIIVNAALDKLKDGEKTTLKDLQKLVSDETQQKGSSIGPVVSFIVKQRQTTLNDVSVELGRYGGIYKGIRTRVAKAEDVRPRCDHCKQVIRAKKNGPRKKKAKGAEAAPAVEETEADRLLASVEAEAENENEDDDDFDDDQDDEDNDDESDDDES